MAARSWEGAIRGILPSRVQKGPTLLTLGFGLLTSREGRVLLLGLSHPVGNSLWQQLQVTKTPRVSSFEPLQPEAGAQGLQGAPGKRTSGQELGPRSQACFLLELPWTCSAR